MSRIAYGWIGLLASFARADEDIRDIRGPKIDAAASRLLIAVVVGALLVAAAAVYVIRHRRKGAPARRLTLLAQTLARLDDTKPLMQPETAREFGIAVSEVIRNYIEKRFAVGATQRTTEEFLQDVLRGQNEALSRHRPLLAQFLERCDLVKFAGATLAAADLESLFQTARGFVSETGESTVA
ncbi:MAG TPA: hypothetical protein VGM84_02215 [Steroidobacteraceae bacterium]